MNQSEETIRNPWRDGTPLPEPGKKATAFAVLTFLFCSLGLPFYDNLYVSLAAILVGFAYLITQARAPYPIMLILVTAVLPLALTGNYSYCAVALALITGLSSGAFLLTTAKRRLLLLFLPAVAYGISFAVSQNAVLSLLSLSLIPAAVLLAIAVRGARSRTSSVCFACGGLLLSLAAVLAVVFRRECGSLNASDIASLIARLQEQASAGMIAFRNTELQMLQNAAAGDNTTLEYYRQLFSDELIRTAVSRAFDLIPGAAVVLCSTVAYESQLLLTATYLTAGLGKAVTRESRVFTMSLPSSVIYAVSFLLAVFISPDTLAGAVVNNLALILMPGLCVIGVQMIFLWFLRLRGGARALFVLALAFFLCCSGAGLFLLALLAAYGGIIAAVRAKLLERFSGNGGDNNGGEL